MRLMRLVLCGAILALPITCQGPNDGTYAGGLQPSPSGRVNPDEPGFVSNGNQR